MLLFVSNNKIVLLGLLIGFVLGYLHWYHFGCCWGTYPLSSEWWVNCASGSLFGGFIASMLKESNVPVSS